MVSLLGARCGLGGVLSQQIAWNGVHALVGTAPVDARGAQAAPGAARAAGAVDITVESAGAGRLAALAGAWDDLAQRADAANVFMHPALLREAIAAYPDRRITALLAWQHLPDAPPRLAGLWAFAIGRAPQSALPLRVLSAPPAPNAYLATPVIDRDCLDAVVRCVPDAHRRRLEPAEHRRARRHGRGHRDFCRARRASSPPAAATCTCSPPRSGRRSPPRSTARPTLSRRCRRRAARSCGSIAAGLAKRARCNRTTVNEPDAVREAFEDFLALEASGWKGREGTALLSDAADAQYARGMIAALAANGEAAIHSLTLDGRPVSMQVVLRSGRTAFTWKTAYDEALHDFSPGTLLLEDYTASLLADRDIDQVDSCAFDDTGYMSAWQERAGLAQLWFDARAGGSAAFTLVVRLQSGYLALRARAKAFYRQRLRRNGR